MIGTLPSIPFEDSRLEKRLQELSPDMLFVSGDASLLRAENELRKSYSALSKSILGQKGYSKSEIQDLRMIILDSRLLESRIGTQYATRTGIEVLYLNDLGGGNARGPPSFLRPPRELLEQIPERKYGVDLIVENVKRVVTSNSELVERLLARQVHVSGYDCIFSEHASFPHPIVNTIRNTISKNHSRRPVIVVSAIELADDPRNRTLFKRLGPPRPTRMLLHTTQVW